jgi:hypothetical protein
MGEAEGGGGDAGEGEHRLGASMLREFDVIPEGELVIQDNTSTHKRSIRVFRVDLKDNSARILL